MNNGRYLEILRSRRRRIVLGDTGGEDALDPDPPGFQLLLEDDTFLLLEHPGEEYLLLEDSP